MNILYEYLLFYMKLYNPIGRLTRLDESFPLLDEGFFYLDEGLGFFR